MDRLESWVKCILKYAKGPYHIFIFGNKLDLESNRKVTFKEAQGFIENLKAEACKELFEVSMHFMGEISCQTGENAIKYCDKAIEIYCESLEKCKYCGAVISDKWSRLQNNQL